jgi:feruloyl esterase
MKTLHLLIGMCGLYCLLAAPLTRAGDSNPACNNLLNAANTFKFANIPDAPTTIQSARVVAAERDLPEICLVEGQVAPTVGFLLRMPTKNWNGKFMMGGCGGPCGNYLVDRVDPALVRNYAVVSTDMGHKGVGWMFAYNNLQGQLDFGYRATHVVAVAAKEIIAEYYEMRAKRNYFWGCSTGGRQAMVSAQRFPHDFEGIIAGAPVYNETGDAPLFLEWNLRANTGADGKAILKASKLPVIQNAVLRACDAIDGLEDGILRDPRQCDWDPADIQCPVGVVAESCLTSSESDVVRKIYEGASNSAGQPLYWGMPRGSEDQWSPIFVAPEEFQLARWGVPGTSITGYMAFSYPPGPAYSIMDFDYDRDPPRLALAETLFSAQNPDLRKFKAAGGKLILFHGWHDNNIPAEASIDYYETATRTMGGENATRDFFRLFMMPAVNHCRHGIGGGEVDWISYLEDWVENEKAPDYVIAHRMIEEPYPVLEGVRASTSNGTYTQMPRHPLDPGSFDQTRPVYAYPDVSQWSGRGRVEDAANWVKVAR